MALRSKEKVTAQGGAPLKIGDVAKLSGIGV